MLSTEPLSKTTPKLWKYIFKIDIQMFTCYCFKHFKYYRENTNWSIVLFLVSAGFFENWRNIGLFQRRRKLWWFNCFIKEYVKIFAKKSAFSFKTLTGMSEPWVAFLCLSFIIWSEISFFSIMLKLKYLFGKAWFIAVILGCLRYLAIAFNVCWDMFSENWSLESNSGISRGLTTFAK